MGREPRVKPEAALRPQAGYARFRVNRCWAVLLSSVIRSRLMVTSTFKFPKQQKLRQGTERGCSVPVFAALAGVLEDEVCRDLQMALDGLVSVQGWMDWLTAQGLDPLKRDGCPADIVPCAHLVGPLQPRNASDFHWVYRDEDGDVHDPDPSFAAMPADDPRMRDLSPYARKELTISVAGRK